MSLKVSDVTKIIEEFAPTKFKESYDNVGLMVGNSNLRVTKILVALDCTLEVIDEAIRNNCNLILTHHPLLFKAPQSITMETVIGRKVIKLISHDISVYSAHTNLDSVKGGLNDIVMEMLGIKKYSTIDKSLNRSQDDNITGIGRIADLENEITLIELCSLVKDVFDIEYLSYSGEETMIVKKVAVINGSGKEYFQRAKELGTNCIITGDTTYHYVSDMCEENIAVIDAGHFNSEWNAFKHIGKMIDNCLQSRGYKNTVMLSKVCSNPYKIK